ncbi:MAG TPA: TonB-dependent receptor [Stenotrophomonas sp.]|nr:TonB-dependent receptor [Stenotrophomonas sp.]
MDTLVVQGEITYRYRSEDVAPTLVYDLEYFQRFEPNTVGDMLKRVPGVGFVGSDIMEYDGAQLRGLGGGYTQVLINGKQVPGAGDDRSFYVDRIPAEMVDHIEIKRSASANRSGDAVAGAINIVLRDAYVFTGSYIRVGVNRWYDGEVNPTFGAVTSFEALGGHLLAGFNVQDRYRAKEKRSDRFTDNTRSEKVSWEDQTEVKDGRDYSANLSYAADIGDSGRLSIDGFYVKTDRDVREVSFSEELDDGETINARVPGLDPYDQKNYGISAEYKFDMAGGTTKLSVDHARFQNSQATTEGEEVYVSGEDQWDQTWSIDQGEWDETAFEAEAVSAKDAETGLHLAHVRPLGNVELEFGVDYRTKKRESLVTFYEWEAEEEGQTPVFPTDYELDGSVASEIREKRLDPYIMFTGKGEVFSWEAGLRYETTRSEVEYIEDEESEGRVKKDYNKLLPSVNLRWDVTDVDRINLSLARTVKRPNFNELIPALLDGEYGDNDYIGNPELDPETANGVDLGFEHRLGRKGVVGLNLFYRDVKDLIEIVNTGRPSTEMEDTWEEMIDDGDAVDLADAMAQEPAESWVYTSSNVGDGKVYGFEFDLSTPLSVFGLDNTGVFVNYSWVDSRVDDFMGERRFNDQAHYVYNIGFIQDLPAWGMSFGATYRKQGDANTRVLGEEGLIRYGAELDAFIEKRFGESFSVRLSANNLLDASKDEFFDKFNTEADQLDRDYDEYELESEQAGPSYQLVARWAF